MRKLILAAAVLGLVAADASACIRPFARLRSRFQQRQAAACAPQDAVLPAAGCATPGAGVAPVARVPATWAVGADQVPVPTEDPLKLLCPCTAANCTCPKAPPPPGVVIASFQPVPCLPPQSLPAAQRPAVPAPTRKVTTVSPTGQITVSQQTVTTTTTTAAATVTNPGDDALDEVNAKRAARGLRPFLRDPLLTVAARGAAAARAARFLFGHNPNDFQFVPPGGFARAAGCAAYPAHMGWLSCCDTDREYTYAGAAYVVGADGKRYMHLFVR